MIVITEYDEDAGGDRSFGEAEIYQRARRHAEQWEPRYEVVGGLKQLMGWIGWHNTSVAREAASLARHALPVEMLVERARDGDQGAWNELVDRHAPLVWSICARYELNLSDIEDIGQAVWLHLADHLQKPAEPQTLPVWLATATQSHCVRVLQEALSQDQAGLLTDSHLLPGESTATAKLAITTAVLNAELRTAFASLPAGCRQVLSMIASDPPLSYAEISSALHVRGGSIGSLRGRCIERLRRYWPLLAMSVLADMDDDQILTSLRDALREGRTVPARIVETGKAAFTSHQTQADSADHPHAHLQ